MIKVDSNREFNLLRDSFSVIKDINPFIPKNVFLQKQVQIIIKNVNVNPTRTGITSILKKMGVKISFLNID